jgi:transposase
MKAKQIDLNPEEVKALLERAQKVLDHGDYELIKAMVETIGLLSQSVDDKATAIKRLLRMLFGASTEKMKNLLKETTETQKDDDSEVAPAVEAEAKKGHGRNGSESYTGAPRIRTPHPTLKAGDSCPECPKGKVYLYEPPGVIVRFTGVAPLSATVYELEKLRCNLCGAVFTAEPPGNTCTEKYDESAAAMIAVLKYGSGFPFHRIEKLQESLGIPLPATTQWDILEKRSKGPYCAWQEMIRNAAQGDLFHNDDTTMKILDLVKEKNPTRKGVYTTGILSVTGERKIALFFTGRKHAGENLLKLLKERHDYLGPPIQMCDALSRNIPAGFETILANCLTHGRRNFVEMINHFPDETRYVIGEIAVVYRNDEDARQRNLSPQGRLAFHQEKSGPVMDRLKKWFSDQFERKKIEPNSGLGKATSYMLKHWDALTLFLRVPGAPLDNNICERGLKKVILHRKNSLFYKTEFGALIGDMFMSLIHTCNLGGINPFEYLKALQKHAPAVAAAPGNWMPWNYRDNLLANPNCLSPKT